MTRDIRNPGRANAARHVSFTGTMALILSAIVLGCSGGAEKTNPEAERSAMDTAARSTVAQETVPAAVEGVGHHSENAYDMAKAGDWARAKAATDSLRTVVAMLPDAAGSAVTEEVRAVRAEVVKTTDALETAVKSRASVEAQKAANRLTELGAKLAAPYGPRVPANVTLLDFYGRELELWAASATAAGDQRLKETASSIRRTWDELRPQVVAHGGTNEAVRFDSLVTAVAGARTRAEYKKLATPVLDEVDVLERVFTR